LNQVDLTQFPIKTITAQQIPVAVSQRPQLEVQVQLRGAANGACNDVGVFMLSRGPPIDDPLIEQVLYLAVIPGDTQQ
jgi:hypothetical protein